MRGNYRILDQHLEMNVLLYVEEMPEMRPRREPPKSRYCSSLWSDATWSDCAKLLIVDYGKLTAECYIAFCTVYFKQFFVHVGSMSTFKS